MESPNDRNDRALRVATAWYSSHLPADSPPVVLVTHIPLSSLFFPRDQKRIPGPGRLQRRVLVTERQPDDIIIVVGSDGHAELEDGVLHVRGRDAERRHTVGV